MNLTSIAFTILAGFGVMVHDSHIDKAALSALKPPSAVMGASAHSAELRTSEHIHTESASERLSRVANTDPKTPARNGEDKKYIGIKKLMINSANGLDV